MLMTSNNITFSHISIKIYSYSYYYFIAAASVSVSIYLFIYQPPLSLCPSLSLTQLVAAPMSLVCLELLYMESVIK